MKTTSFLLTTLLGLLIGQMAFAQQPERELKLIGSKYGYTGPGGNMVIDARFDVTDDVRQNRSRYQFYEWRALVSIKGKYGFVNPKGMPVITYKYEKADRFSNLRASFTENGKCGYLDRMGKEVIPARFEPTTEWGTCDCFKEGFAKVTEGKDYALIDSSGKLLTDFDYDDIEVRDGGAIVALKKKDYAILGADGSEKTDFDFREVGEFNSYGVAIVKDKKNYGIVNKDGIILAELDYEKIDPYDRYGFAKAVKDGETIFLDRRGKPKE